MLEQRQEITERQRLLRLSQFILGTPAKETRSELIEGLVQVGILFNGPRKSALTQDEVEAAVRYVCDLPSFPPEPVRAALERLVKKGSVARSKDRPPTYSLDPVAAARWDGLIRSTFDTYDAAVTDVVREVEKALGSLSKEQVEIVTRVFEESVVGIVTSQGDAAARVFAGSISGPTIPDETPKPTLASILETIGDPGLRRALQHGLRDAFNNPTDNLSKTLAWIANTYLLTKVLNLDPDCRALEREFFSKCRLYLDTNVLLACLLPSHPRFRATSRLLGVCSKLGIDLRYTGRTAGEFERLIERADELYKRDLPARAPSVGYYEHDVVKTYIQHFQSSGMSWREYVLMLSKSGSKLEKQFGIKLEVADYDKVVAPEEVAALAPLVVQSSLWHIKSPDVAAHDAFHILLIKKLRTVETGLSFGSPWFLSLDYTLSDAEAFMQVARTAESYDSTVTCDLWADVLLPFMSLDVEEENLSEVYASLVGSHFFPVARTISVGGLIRHIAPYLQDPFLDADDIAWILQHQHLQQVLRTAASESKEPDVQTLATVVAGLIDQRKDQKLADLGSTVKSLEGRVLEIQAAAAKRLEGKVSEMLKLQQEAIDRETAKWQSQLESRIRYQSKMEMINELVLGMVLALLVGVIATALWVTTGSLTASIAAIGVGISASGALIAVVRHYRAVLKSS